ELIVGEWLALLLLDIVRGARDHTQDIATQPVTAAHRDGDIGLDAILKGHRSGTSGGRATAVTVGRRLARGDSGTERSGAGPLSRPAFGRSSCALLPCACASQRASRSARGGEPRRGCRSAGSSC